MNAYEIAVATSKVAKSWASDGKSAPATPSTTAVVCAIPECAGMSFVELRTSLGPTALCFAHFESVKADLGA